MCVSVVDSVVVLFCGIVFFFNQKTAYEMRISDWSSDVCSSDLRGLYIACESTFYRVLKAENQLKHRGAQRPSQARTKPRALQARGPNQLFSWDITYLPTRIKGIYFYLYLFMDLFSQIGRAHV